MVLEGSKTSYAQFKKWDGGTDSSLSFEFRTESREGLLVYTDDPTTCDNLELKLVDGRLRLRMNTGAGDLANTEIIKRKILDTTGDCIAAKFGVEVQSANNSQHIYPVSIESRKIPLANTKMQKHTQTKTIKLT